MTYVISDLHGYPVEKLEQLLESAGFSDADYCFILGDVIDRGEHGAQLLKWLLGKTNVQLILGNHEAMLLSCGFLFEEISEETLLKMNAEQFDLVMRWMANGGEPTMKGLSAMSHEEIDSIIEYLKDAPLYETVDIGNKRYLLTHGGLGNFSHDKSIEDYTANELLWNRPLPDDAYYKEVITVFGHTPTAFIDPNTEGRVIFTDTWIDIDTGASLGLPPTLLCLDTMREYRIEIS